MGNQSTTTFLLFALATQAFLAHLSGANPTSNHISKPQKRDIDAPDACGSLCGIVSSYGCNGLGSCGFTPGYGCKNLKACCLFYSFICRFPYRCVATNMCQDCCVNREACCDADAQKSFANVVLLGVLVEGGRLALYIGTRRWKIGR